MATHQQRVADRHKRERFARALARLTAEGVPAQAAQIAAGIEAGYPQGHSVETFVANCRKRARRPDVKAIVAAALAPGTEVELAEIAATREQAIAKLSQIMRYDLGSDACKIPDQLRAVELLAKLNGWNAPEQHVLALKPIEQMTDDELLRVVAEARASHGGNSLPPPAAQ